MDPWESHFLIPIGRLLKIQYGRHLLLFKMVRLYSLTRTHMIGHQDFDRMPLEAEILVEICFYMAAVLKMLNDRQLRLFKMVQLYSSTLKMYD